MADAELTPRELGRYVDSYASPAQKPVMIYTLGMRYFRLGNYARAVSTFKRLTRSQRLRFGLGPGEMANVLEQVTNFDQLPHERDPLRSVRRLWRLDQIAHRARNPERRAKALYSMAAYIYGERTLLFYSPGLWKGDRSFAISTHWNPEINNKAEKRTLEQYCHEHETLAHVMPLCKTVEGLHLHSPVVAKALYMDGLATERLSNLNEWWRARRGLKKRAVSSMKRLVRLYPHDPLAKPAAKYAAVFAEEDSPNYNR